MFCPDCKTNLDDIEIGRPCPVCGGDRRSAVVQPRTVDVVVDVNQVGVQIRRGDNRPWIEKWMDVLHCQESISAAYIGSESVGNVEVDRRVSAFFVECDHIRDWLKGDIASLHGVSTDDVDRHFQSSLVLQVCNAICNTHKHHTRRSGIAARIRETTTSRYGARVVIEADWTSPNATTFDALDLSEQCVDSWRSFFNAHGIAAP